MEKSEITLSFDAERMRALTIYLKMENTTVQEKMDEAMRQLYERTVPEPVREFLDIISAPPARPRRPTRPSQPRQRAASSAPVPMQGEELGTAETGQETS